MPTIKAVEEADWAVGQMMGRTDGPGDGWWRTKTEHFEAPRALFGQPKRSQFAPKSGTMKSEECIVKTMVRGTSEASEAISKPSKESDSENGINIDEVIRLEEKEEREVRVEIEKEIERKIEAEMKEKEEMRNTER